MRMRIYSILIIMLVFASCATPPVSLSTALDPNLSDRELTESEYKKRGDNLNDLLDIALLPPAIKNDQNEKWRVILNAVSGGIGLAGVGLTALLSDETAVNWTGYGFSVFTIAISTYNLVVDSLTQESLFVSDVLNAQNEWRLNTLDKTTTYESDYNILYRAVCNIKFHYPVLSSSIDFESL